MIAVLSVAGAEEGIIGFATGNMICVGGIETQEGT